MRVLTVHNYYQQPGGEDQVFHAETRLLREHGHQVVEFTTDNRRIDGANPLQLAAQTVWSESSRRKLAALLSRFRPEVAHFHNIFPLISPAAYYACQRAGVAVVQTLHNYRLDCPKATHYRDGHICEDCGGLSVAWPGVLHACYHESRLMTGVIAVMNTTHRFARTWTSQVDIYVALSNFARQQHLRAGLPAERVVVKGNFVHPDPGIGQQRDRFVLFVGRLTSEKGVQTLLRAWAGLGGSVPLKIVGDGELAENVRAAAASVPGIEWIGHQPRAVVLDLMGRATALVFPSEWYEPCPLVTIEALARGTPVIAAAVGAIPEIVEHERTGLLYAPGQADHLAAAVGWAANHATDLATMGANARRSFEASFTAERNYAEHVTIYELALRATLARKPGLTQL